MIPTIVGLPTPLHFTLQFNGRVSSYYRLVTILGFRENFVTLFGGCEEDGWRGLGGLLLFFDMAHRAVAQSRGTESMVPVSTAVQIESIEEEFGCRVVVR